MPSIAAHMVTAKLVSEILGINDKEFIKGNLLPDVILDNESHHKIKGKYFLIPNLDYFKNNLDLNNKLELGYYTHLLLDYYFLEEYVPNKINDLTVFSSGIIYKEYDLINYELLNNFDVDICSYSDILEELYLYPNINSDKLEKDLSCFNNKEIKETKYLKVDEFSNFLDKISYVISKEVSEYANKPCVLTLHT